MDTIVVALFLNTFVIIYIMAEMSLYKNLKHFKDITRRETLQFGLKIFIAYQLFLFISYFFGKLFFLKT